MEEGPAFEAGRWKWAVDFLEMVPTDFCPCCNITLFTCMGTTFALSEILAIIYFLMGLTLVLITFVPVGVNLTTDPPTTEYIHVPQSAMAAILAAGAGLSLFWVWGTAMLKGLDQIHQALSNVKGAMVQNVAVYEQQNNIFKGEIFEQKTGIMNQMKSLLGLDAASDELDHVMEEFERVGALFQSNLQLQNQQRRRQDVANKRLEEIQKFKSYANYEKELYNEYLTMAGRANDGHSAGEIDNEEELARFLHHSVDLVLENANKHCALAKMLKDKILTEDNIREFKARIETGFKNDKRLSKFELSDAFDACSKSPVYTLTRPDLQLSEKEEAWRQQKEAAIACQIEIEEEDVQCVTIVSLGKNKALTAVQDFERELWGEAKAKTCLTMEEELATLRPISDIFPSTKKAGALDEDDSESKDEPMGAARPSASQIADQFRINPIGSRARHGLPRKRDQEEKSNKDKSKVDESSESRCTELAESKKDLATLLQLYKYPPHLKDYLFRPPAGANCNHPIEARDLTCQSCKDKSTSEKFITFLDYAKYVHLWKNWIHYKDEKGRMTHWMGKIYKIGRAHV